jgi:hypothetical protein
MAVKYSLHPNNLNGNKGTYYAQVVNRGTVDIEDIIKHVKKSGSSVSESDFLAVYIELQKAVIHFIEQGFKVNTSLFRMKASITGKFENFDQGFKKGEHVVNVCAEPGKQVLKAARFLKVEKVKPKVQMAVILQYKDLASKETDKVVTPGGMATIYGEFLKVDPEDESQGIFLVNELGEKTKVDHIGQNTMTSLVFLNPSSLTAGPYKLEIVQRVKNNKTTRSSVFPLRLIVR